MACQYLLVLFSTNDLSGLSTSVTFLLIIDAPVFGLSPLIGGAFGILVMSGDLAASFIKRRLAYVESSRFRALDVLPESLLPILILREALELTIVGSIFTVSFFFIFEVLLSPILFRLHIRKRPY